VPIYLYPAVVQGEQAPASLSEGLDFLSARPEVDVIILARGGGSAQDLIAFNTEAVAKAIFHCSKPVISAVGHETDVTVADMTADVRAATPSVAAELAVPQLEELTLQLNKEKQRLYQAVKAFINRMEALFSRLKNSAVLVSASKWWLTPKMDYLLHLDANLHKAMDEALTRARHRLALKSGQLQALSPLATLSRGYAVCMDDAGRVILRAGQVETGDPVQVRLSSGRIGCRVLTREDEHDSKDDI
jgi:exodeoxyribonuclease VII large subunit